MYKEWERCFVLHCRSFGDTSLIVDLFSKNQGKISVLAKGAKKPRSKYFGIFTPFKEVKITLHMCLYSAYESEIPHVQKNRNKLEL